MITYSESFIKFLQESSCKIARILYYAHTGRFPAYRLFVTADSINYITFRTDGTISFLPAGKEHKAGEDGTWKREGRQNGKPGKVIQKLFTKRALALIHGKEFEAFSNGYKAASNIGDYTFHLRDNTSIPDVYRMSRAPGGGSLENSCMNNESTGYYDIYKYCGKVKILILVNKDDRLCGRALVWQVSDTLTIMDRIYVAHDFMYELFLTHAKEKLWYHKRDYKTYDNKTEFVSPEGDYENMDLTIRTGTDHEQYPYIDTFSYGDDGSLNNYGGGHYEYDQTDGTRGPEQDDDDHGTYDEIAGYNIDDDDAIRVTNGRYADCYTHRDNTVRLEGRSGVWWENDECLVSIDGSHYHHDDVVYSEYDRRYYPEDDCVFCENLDSYILIEDSVEIDGVTHHKDKVPESITEE